MEGPAIENPGQRRIKARLNKRGEIEQESIDDLETGPALSRASKEKQRRPEGVVSGEIDAERFKAPEGSDIGARMLLLERVTKARDRVRLLADEKTPPKGGFEKMVEDLWTEEAALKAFNKAGGDIEKAIEVVINAETDLALEIDKMQGRLGEKLKLIKLEGELRVQARARESLQEVLEELRKDAL